MYQLILSKPSDLISACIWLSVTLTILQNDTSRLVWKFLLSYLHCVYMWFVHNHKIQLVYIYFLYYRKTSNISRTLVGNKIVDNSCSWSISCRRCSNCIFILNLTPGFHGLGKDHCKRRQETFKFWDLVRLILEVLRYVLTFQQVIVWSHVDQDLSCHMAS